LQIPTDDKDSHRTNLRMIPIHPLFSDGEPRLYAAILPCSCPWVYVLKTNELRKYSICLHRGSRISDNFSLHLARLANEAASDEIQEKCVENSLCITVLRKSPILLPSDALRIHLVTIGVDTVHILKNHYIHNVFCLCREKNNPLMKFRLMWESSSPPFPSLRCSDWLQFSSLREMDATSLRVLPSLPSNPHLSTK